MKLKRVVRFNDCNVPFISDPKEEKHQKLKLKLKINVKRCHKMNTLICNLPTLICLEPKKLAEHILICGLDVWWVNYLDKLL